MRSSLPAPRETWVVICVDSHYAEPVNAVDVRLTPPVTRVQLLVELELSQVRYTGARVVFPAIEINIICFFGVPECEALAERLLPLFLTHRHNIQILCLEWNCFPGFLQLR